MKKNELIRLIAKEAGITLAEAERFLSVTTHIIQTNMQKGEKVSLAGFGSFYVGKRAARVGRNPKTGAVIKIKAANSPKFKAGTNLKFAVAGDFSTDQVYSRTGRVLNQTDLMELLSLGTKGTDSTGPKKPKK